MFERSSKKFIPITLLSSSAITELKLGLDSKDNVVSFAISIEGKSEVKPCFWAIVEKALNIIVPTLSASDTLLGLTILQTLFCIDHNYKMLILVYTRSLA